MSRIHEALRKAEQERETTAIDVASLMEATPVEVQRGAPGTASEPALTASPLLTPEVERLGGLRQRCAKVQWKPNPRAIVFTEDSRSPLAEEQFRTLRSRLYHLREKFPHKRLLVTSSLPGEGKTFVASNLAYAIVLQQEQHVLLIDGDLRASRLHTALGAPSAPGLSDYLRGDADESAVIQCNSGGNLFFIPGGKPAENPAELLANQRLKTLLDSVTPLFDWIVIDSPPALPVSDASLLGSHCDSVLLVVKAGSTPFDAARKASTDFREKNLIGVVLNRAEASGGYYSYYYYAGKGKTAE